MSKAHIESRSSFASTDLEYTQVAAAVYCFVKGGFLDQIMTIARTKEGESHREM